jgi:homoserine kinase type II
MCGMSTTGAPTLEMLWESDDPAGVLLARFGLTDGRAAREWVATALSRHWGIEVSDCQRIVMSDHNALAWLATPSDRLIAKWSVAPQRFARLSELADLTVWLAERGAPVSTPILTADGSSHAESGQALLVLQRLIEGDPLEATNLDQVRAAGAVLARLHGELARYPHAGRLRQSSPTPSTSLPARVTSWLDGQPHHVPSRLLTSMRRLMDTAPTEPMPTQLVHGDFRAANILCSGTRVLAIIDFEEARFDHPIAELARSAVMLGTKFRNWGPVSTSVRAEFLAGYESERRLNAIEARWWDILVSWYSLTMIPPDEDPTGWRAAAAEHLERVAPGPATLCH